MRFTTLATLVGYRTDDATFIEDIARSDKPVDLLYEVYRQTVEDQHQRNTEADPKRFGCFRYDFPWRSTQKLRLHFLNADRSGAPLSSDRLAVRRLELRQLVHDIERRGLKVSAVRGGSWAYNLPAYRRIFPYAFIKRLVPIPAEPTFMSQWGQFVRADGSLRADMAETFVARLNESTTTAECLRAFPFPVLKAQCDYDAFRDGVQRA